MSIRGAIMKEGVRELIESVEEVRRRLDSLYPAVGDVVGSLLDGGVRMTRVSEMHEVAACSPAVFDRWFVEELGIPPGQFLRRLAVYRSLQLLVRSPHAGLDGVAHEVGYGRNSSLNRVWKELTGITVGMAAKVLRSNGSLPRGIEGVSAAARLIDDACR